VTPSSPDDDIERLLREMQQLNEEAAAVTGHGEVEPATGRTADRTPQPSEGTESKESETGGMRRRAVVVGVVAATTITLLFSLLAPLLVLVPAPLEWAAAAFLAALGVGMYESWAARRRR
jgi:hypothetical protein